MHTKQYLLRVSHGYDIDHVAAHLNISNEDYSKIESGEYKPDPQQAKLLGELYNVDPKYFLTEDYTVVNYNSGPNSHSGPIYIYNSSVGLKELYEKLLKESGKQNEQIKSLKVKLSEVGKKRKK